MIEPEKPLKKKDQTLVDEEITQRLQEELQAELEEDERLARQKEEEDNLISWDNTQAMMEADYELAQRLQAEEQGELTIEERSKLLRSEENHQPNPKRGIKCRLWKEVKSRQKEIRRELESDNSKKQKIDENVKAEVDEEAEMKKLMEIVPDEETAVDAIPLATKPPIIKLVKAKHGNTRTEEAYEKVLWGDLKVMCEPDVESEVWRNLQGYNVTVWKLFSSSGVNFVRFQNLHIFMLVEKKYPLTPATIIKMLNKKLQTDQWNKMCYQLLKLMTRQHKNPGSV
ncbi:hypothetical protein Tco_1563034 [Tanacetum coccineum]